MEKWLTQRNAVLVVLAATLWRLHLAAALQLHPDEAYYWLWSRQLDIGYFDHPPMVAYFIWLSTLFSKSELWVRLSGPLVVVVMSGLLWRLALQIYKSVPLAAGSVILFNVFPLTLMGLVVVTPDTPVLLFWSLSVYSFWQVIQRQRPWAWYALGLAFGLALLSKYTAILMVPSFLLYLLLTEDRRWLKTVHPYLALLLGFACFLPVVIWNSRHDWISFTFQSRNGLGGDNLDAVQVAEYIAGQMLISGPVAWLLGIVATVAVLSRKAGTVHGTVPGTMRKETLFLVCAAVPVILFFAVSSFRKTANPNWPAFAYFSFSLLVTHYCLEGYSKLRRSLWSAAVASSLALSLVATLHARFSILPLASHSQALADADFTNWFYGWRELGEELKQHADYKFAISPSHQLGAQIIYYTDGSLSAQTARLSRLSQFDMWHASLTTNGKDGLYVWTPADNVGPDGRDFPARAVSQTFNAYREGRVVRSYQIFAGKLTDSPPDTPLPGAAQLLTQRGAKGSDGSVVR